MRVCACVRVCAHALMCAHMCRHSSVCRSAPQTCMYIFIHVKNSPTERTYVLQKKSAAIQLPECIFHICAQNKKWIARAHQQEYMRHKMQAALMYVYHIRRYIRAHTHTHTHSFICRCASAHQPPSACRWSQHLLLQHAANNCILDTHTAVIVFWLKFKKPLVASTRSSTVNGFASAESELQPITKR